jgi:uncharacterized damage-inducible protein DinB
MNGRQYLFFYERDINKVIDELKAYKQEDELWATVGNIRNGAGHLCQHLAGNLNTFIGWGIGGIDYKRDREAEFGQRQYHRSQLEELLKDTLSRIQQALSPLDEAALAKGYPREIYTLKEDQTIEDMLTHLLAHLNWHLGQINYHRRLVKNFHS